MTQLGRLGLARLEHELGQLCRRTIVVGDEILCRLIIFGGEIGFDGIKELREFRVGTETKLIRATPNDDDAIQSPDGDDRQEQIAQVARELADRTELAEIHRAEAAGVGGKKCRRGDLEGDLFGDEKLKPVAVGAHAERGAADRPWIAAGKFKLKLS